MATEIANIKLEFKLFATDTVIVNDKEKEQKYYLVKSFDEVAQLIDE